MRKVEFVHELMDSQPDIVQLFKLDKNIKIEHKILVLLPKFFRTYANPKWFEETR